MLKLPFTIYQGDYREGMSRLPEQSVDLVLTDPPYGTTNIKWDTAPNLGEFWDLVHRAAKPDAVIISFCAQPFTTDLINSNRKNFRYELIWYKTVPVGFLNAKIRPLVAHETMLVFTRKLKASTYNPQMTEGKPYKARSGGSAQHYGQHRKCNTDNPGVRYPRSVMHYSNRSRDHFHPTQKPIELVENLVRTYSNEGETVVDPFMGSGTTLVAAVKTSRFAIGMERERDYIMKAAARLSQVAV